MTYVNPINVDKVKYGIFKNRNIINKILNIKNFASRKKFKCIMKNNAIFYPIFMCTKYQLYFLVFHLYFLLLYSAQLIMHCFIPVLKLYEKINQKIASSY